MPSLFSLRCARLGPVGRASESRRVEHEARPVDRDVGHMREYLDAITVDLYARIRVAAESQGTHLRRDALSCDAMERSRSEIIVNARTRPIFAPMEELSSDGAH
jgi:hypothetical protein